MKTIRLVLTAAAFFCAASITVPAAPAASKPNILVILADDMGYSDAGCYGGEIQTPNLNRLADNGVRFSQFYNTARCWPSRCDLLTGYYAQAVRRDALPSGPLGEFGEGSGKGGGQGIRPRWAQLLPAYLKPLGYRSYHSGKWHIDGKVLAGGFDRSYCIEDHNRFFSPKEHELDDVKLPPVQLGTNFYLTTFIADNAISFLKEHAEKHSGQPFFEYLAFTSPHFPLHAKPEDIAIYKDIYEKGWDAIRAERFARLKKLGLVSCDLSPRDPVTSPRWNLSDKQMLEKIGPDEIGHAVPWDSLTPEQKKFQASKMAVHAAMVHRMDIEIGRVLDQLKAMGALDNTIVMFMSDNGASAEQIIRGDGHDPAAPVGSAKTFLGIGAGWSTAANTPFRLHKSWVHEGGISTPLIVQWPAGIKAHGELRHNPGHLVDIVPTLLDIAGGKIPQKAGEFPVPPLHGKSLAPVFAKDDSVPHDYFWWFHDGNRAVRVGDWKLVADHSSPWELYDLRHDRSETQNMAPDNDEKVKELEKVWQKHAKEFNDLAQQDPPPAAPAKKKGKAGKTKAAGNKAE